MQLDYLLIHRLTTVSTEVYMQLYKLVINLAARGRNSEVTVICSCVCVLPRRANAWARYCTWSNGMCQCVYVCKAQMTLRLHNSASTTLADTKLH